MCPSWPCSTCQESGTQHRGKRWPLLKSAIRMWLLKCELEWDYSLQGKARDIPVCWWKGNWYREIFWLAEKNLCSAWPPTYGDPFLCLLPHLFLCAWYLDLKHISKEDVLALRCAWERGIIVVSSHRGPMSVRTAWPTPSDPLSKK